MPAKHTYGSVVKEFSDRGCVLLSKEYRNNKTPLDFICKCGKTHRITLNDLKGGHFCKWCGIEKQASSKALSYAYVSDFFKKQGCELLSKTYVNSRTKMQYKCTCGKISEINWDNFKQGQRCYSCGIEAISGENCHLWKEDKTDEERLGRSYIEGYNSWRTAVYKRDKYTCQCCGSNKGGNLNAHHIFNFANFKELRIDLSNGITLCEICHKQFHKTYGFTNTDDVQLKEFLDTHKTKAMRKSS